MGFSCQCLTETLITHLNNTLIAQSVCIHEKFAHRAAEVLHDTDVNICCVVDFPGGDQPTSSRVA